MSFFRRYVTVHFYDFLILVTSKTKEFKVTTSNTRNIKGFLTFFLLYLRFWFIGKCHSFADMLRYITTTSSYSLPPKPRFFRSLLQTRNLKSFLAFILQIYFRFWFGQCYSFADILQHLLRLPHNCNL